MEDSQGLLVNLPWTLAWAPTQPGVSELDIKPQSPFPLFSPSLYGFPVLSMSWKVKYGSPISVDPPGPAKRRQAAYSQCPPWLEPSPAPQSVCQPEQTVRSYHPAFST